jgi:phospholipid-binding lipoprotein MlaA
MRDAYLQRRRYLIYDGNLPEDKEGGKSPDGKDTGDATVSPYQRFTPNWPVFRR